MGSRSLSLGAVLVPAVLASACTVTAMGPEDAPPRIEARGLIDGHAAFGMRAEDDFFRLRVLDGESSGALAEVVLWKLFRLEVGALGFGVGIGPFDLALGTLFFDPRVPGMTDEKADRKPDRSVEPGTQCEVCAAAERKAAEEKVAGEE